VFEDRARETTGNNGKQWLGKGRYLFGFRFFFRAPQVHNFEAGHYFASSLEK
jgi:hypothetical protein